MFKPKKSRRAATSPSNSTGFAGVRAQVDRAFKKAAKSAVVENDALGVATHGSARGKLVVRTPAKRNKHAIA